MKVLNAPAYPPSQNSLAISPLPLKKDWLLSQPTLNVCATPAGSAQVMVAGPVLTALAVGEKKNDVPKTRSKTLNFLLVSLAKKDINLVNSFFQSVHLVFNGTAPIWS